MAITVSLTRLFPRPRPVTLAGRTFLVGEMRLADLVDLQDYLDRRWESPLEALRPTLAGMDARDCRAALADVWDACEAGPPAWGSDEALAAFAEAPGILETFRVALRTHHPDLTIEQVTAIAERTTPDEYAALLAVWRRVDPIDELAWLLEMGEGDAGGTPIGWAQAVCELCETYGWALEDCLGLSLRQIGVARSCGKPRERGALAPPGSVREVHARMRARMNGDGGHGAHGNGRGDAHAG